MIVTTKTPPTAPPAGETLPVCPTAQEPEYRVLFHQPDGTPTLYHPKIQAEDSYDQLSRKLDLLVEFGIATGGHIEEFINDDIGWVVANVESYE